MSGYHTRRTTSDQSPSGGVGGSARSAPGKQTLVEMIYRSPAPGGGGADTSSAQAALDQAGDASGEPLAADTRGKLESSIGSDLSEVRVHTGASSAAAASSIGAEAYAVGNDIHFAAGKYEPGGNHLLAHEVAHTVQQKGSIAAPQAKLAISSPGDAHEVAAGRFADAFVAGQAHPVAPAVGIQGVVSRNPDGGMDGGVPHAGGMDAGAGGAGAGTGAAPSPAGTPSPALAANACTPEDAAQQSSAALQSFEAEINQCVAPPAPAPAAAGPACHVELSSRPLNQALSEMMRAEGMTPAQISSVWSTVQRRVATSYGTFYNTIGAVQRAVYALLEVAESLERIGGVVAAAGVSMRNAAAAYLTAQLPLIHEQVKQQIAHAAVDAIQAELHRTVPCLAEQVKAAVDGALPQSAFGAIDLTTGTSRQVRYRVTSQCAAYRTAVQTAMEAVAGTTFRPFLTGDATGLHMEMLTSADHATRAAAAGTTLDAGHLHMNGGNAVDVQSMAWDVYQMQVTSNNGNLLVRNMVTGSGQNFDVVMTAVNNSPTTSYDAFINNEVDLADIHAERSLPLPNTSNHPQAQESVYAHFMHERQYDATHSGTNMTAINTQAQALEAQRVQLVADRAALPPRVQTALGGGVVAPPLTAAETAQANAWGARAVAWQNARTANDAAFNARFTAAHSYAIDQENAYNRERGFDDTRPH